MNTRLRKAIWYCRILGFHNYILHVLKVQRVVTARLRGFGKLTVRLGGSDLYTLAEVFFFDYLKFPTLPANPKVIVDLGANIGASVRWFHVVYPGARIVAIEPDALNFALLGNNAGNDSSCRRLAAWSASDVTLSLEDSQVESNIRKYSPGGVASDVVRTISVADLLQELGPVDVLKIDIEGAEVEVLEDLEVWIHQVGAIIIEFHDQWRPGSREMLTARLKKAGFLSAENEEKVLFYRA